MVRDIFEWVVVAELVALLVLMGDLAVRMQREPRAPRWLWRLMAAMSLACVVVLGVAVRRLL